MKFFYPYLILISTLLIDSCTVTRGIVYNQPAVGDHRLFDTCEFKASPHPTLLPHRVSESLELSPKFMAETKTLAYVVVKDGAVVSESYANDFGANTQSDLFSISKSIVSLLLGIAIHDGQVGSVNDSLGKYLVHLRPQVAGVKLVDLLDMCSSIDNTFWLKTFHYYGYNLKKSARAARLTFHTKGTFQYSDCSTQLLAMVVEAATRKSLPDYFREKIWEPLNMQNHGSWTLDSEKYRNARAFCGLNMTVIDLAKIGLLCLNNGVWEGKQIVPCEWLDTTTRLRNTKPTYIDGYYYNNHWRVVSPDAYYAKGLFGQYLYIDKARNLIIIRLGTQEGGVHWIDYFTARHHGL